VVRPVVRVLDVDWLVDYCRQFHGIGTPWAELVFSIATIGTVTSTN
jgi:hypothetical protein